MIYKVDEGKVTAVVYDNDLRGFVVDTSAKLPPSTKEYSELYDKVSKINEQIMNLKSQRHNLKYEMAKALIYPYSFGDRVKVTTYSAYSDYQRTYKGVINFDPNGFISISDIKKDGSVSLRAPHKLYLSSIFEVSDYEE